MTDTRKRNGGRPRGESFERFEDLARKLFAAKKEETPQPHSESRPHASPSRLSRGLRRFAMSLTPGKKELRCSFCGKDKDHVQFLIAGPAVFICGGCVDLCVGIIEKTKASGSAPPMPPAQ